VTLSAGPSTSVAGASSVSTTTRSIPTHLTIPAIGVSTNLTQLGLLANGDPQVPTSWYTAGWYKLGPTPGQLGSSVILGHVDSVAGPAVFYKLVDMKVGELVKVKLTDGATVSFKVIAVLDDLPSAQSGDLWWGV
jgi:sortase (surface protein transpeptidase)